MEIKVCRIGKEHPEEVEIRCHEVTEEVREIVAFVKTRQGQLTGHQEGRQYEVAVTDVCYVEAVDNKVFLYTQKQVYETRQKLYELEELLREKHFLRVSKSLLLNLMKVWQSLRKRCGEIRGAAEGRFLGEEKNDHAGKGFLDRFIENICHGDNPDHGGFVRGRFAAYAGADLWVSGIFGAASLWNCRDAAKPCAIFQT